MTDSQTTPEAPTPNEEPRRALLLDPDLFFSVKVSTTLRRMGIITSTVSRLEQWMRQIEADRFVITLVNIAGQAVDWREAIVAARKAGMPVIAYGSHVDIESQAQARAAGASRVIANSKLAADLPTIVEQTLRRHGDATPQRENDEAPSSADTSEDDI